MAIISAVCHKTLYVSVHFGQQIRERLFVTDMFFSLFGCNDLSGVWIKGDMGFAPCFARFLAAMFLGTPTNVPPGTRLSIGTVELVITEEPHNGCQVFIDHYGRDACLFVNTGRGKELRLRGIYGRVTKDGKVSVGDTVREVP